MILNSVGGTKTNYPLINCGGLSSKVCKFYSSDSFLILVRYSVLTDILVIAAT